MKTKKTAASGVDLIRQKSDNAIGVIKQLIAQLKSTNDEAEAEKASNVDKISKLEQDNAALDDVCAQNSKIIHNFENLLS